MANYWNKGQKLAVTIQYFHKDSNKQFFYEGAPTRELTVADHSAYAVVMGVTWAFLLGKVNWKMGALVISLLIFFFEKKFNL